MQRELQKIAKIETRQTFYNLTFNLKNHFNCKLNLETKLCGQNPS